MGTPSSINRQVLRKLCAKFDTFVTSVTIRPIFCTKRPDYLATPTIVTIELNTSAYIRFTMSRKPFELKQFRCIYITYSLLLMVEITYTANFVVWWIQLFLLLTVLYKLSKCPNTPGHKHNEHGVPVFWIAVPPAIGTTLKLVIYGKWVDGSFTTVNTVDTE